MELIKCFGFSFCFLVSVFLGLGVGFCDLFGLEFLFLRFLLWVTGCWIHGFILVLGMVCFSFGKFAGAFRDHTFIFIYCNNI